MNGLEPRAIVQCLDELCKRTTGQDQLVTIWRTKEVMVAEDYERIKSERTPYGQNLAIYNHLSKKNIPWSLLLETLGSCGNRELADMLSQRLEELTHEENARTGGHLLTTSTGIPPPPFSSNGETTAGYHIENARLTYVNVMKNSLFMTPPSFDLDVDQIEVARHERTNPMYSIQELETLNQNQQNFLIHSFKNELSHSGYSSLRILSYSQKLREDLAGEYQKIYEGYQNMCKRLFNDGAASVNEIITEAAKSYNDRLMKFIEKNPLSTTSDIYSLHLSQLQEMEQNVLKQLSQPDLKSSQQVIGVCLQKFKRECEKYRQEAFAHATRSREEALESLQSVQNLVRTKVIEKFRDQYDLSNPQHQFHLDTMIQEDLDISWETVWKLFESHWKGKCREELRCEIKLEMTKIQNAIHHQKNLSTVIIQPDTSITILMPFLSEFCADTHHLLESGQFFLDHDLQIRVHEAQSEVTTKLIQNLAGSHESKNLGFIKLMKQFKENLEQKSEQIVTLNTENMERVVEQSKKIYEDHITGHASFSVDIGSQLQIFEEAENLAYAHLQGKCCKTPSEISDICLRAMITSATTNSNSSPVNSNPPDLVMGPEGTKSFPLLLTTDPNNDPHHIDEQNKSVEFIFSQVDSLYQELMTSLYHSKLPQKVEEWKEIETQSSAQVVQRKASILDSLGLQVQNRILDKLKTPYRIFQDTKILQRRTKTNRSIGIDLGTTSCVAYHSGQQTTVIPDKMGRKLIPSWVFYPIKEKEGQPIVGTDARKKAGIHPRYVIYDFRSLLGHSFSDPWIQECLTRWPFRVEDDGRDKPIVVIHENRRYTPVQIMSEVIKHIKSVASAHLERNKPRAVVTIPAKLQPGQLELTFTAVVDAGLDVLQLISEPVAAAMAYSFNLEPLEKIVMVFHFSLSALTVSILKTGQWDGDTKNDEKALTTFRQKCQCYVRPQVQMSLDNIHIISTFENCQLGGSSLDTNMVNYLVNKFETDNPGVNVNQVNERDNLDVCRSKGKMKELRKKCEELKINLTTKDDDVIFIRNFHGNLDLKERISRDLLRRINEDIFKKCMGAIEGALKEGSIDRELVNDIILIGGASNYPEVKSQIEQFFEPNTPKFHDTIDKNEAIASGAAIQAFILDSHFTARQLV